MEREGCVSIVSLVIMKEADENQVYLGDSASLSYLDTIRRLVESTLGPSEFTRDKHKQRILEGLISVAARPTHVLPDREAADFLVDSFFSNVKIFVFREHRNLLTVV